MLTPTFYTYIATNKRSGTLYTGHTDNIGARGEQHLHGTFDGFAKRHGCRYIVWFEVHDTRDEAFVRERRIKEWRRSWKLELIEGVNPHWIDVVASPVWPLPDAEEFRELYEQCLAFALDRYLDPDFRLGERKIKIQPNPSSHGSDRVIHCAVCRAGSWVNGAPALRIVNAPNREISIHGSHGRGRAMTVERGASVHLSAFKALRPRIPSAPMRAAIPAVTGTPPDIILA